MCDRIPLYMEKNILKYLFLSIVVLFSLLLSLTQTPLMAEEYYELPTKISKLYGINLEEKEESCLIKKIGVCYDGKTTFHLVRSGTPITALIDLNYPVSNRSRITSTSPISFLYNNSYILVETYKSTIEELMIDIPFETVRKGDVLCQKLAKEEIEQEGVLGLMVQKIEKVYVGNTLIAEEVIEERIEREPRPQIIVIQGSGDLLSSVPKRGANCSYWGRYIDGINATEEEKRWLKSVMDCESRCNAESNISYYKGLFQWDPCLWYRIYPDKNIFSGEEQIAMTLQKLREGGHTMWPACHRQYKSKYGELSWL